MTAKIFVGPDQTAIINCPNCKKTREINLSAFKGINAKIKCRCGKIWRIELEFRRQFRKKTELTGTYKVFSADGQPAGSGFMTVVDLSLNGLRMRLKGDPPPLKIGDFLNVRFSLDDESHTLINRHAVVRYINDPYVGAMFKRSSDTDNDIGFYLLGKRCNITR